MPGLARACPPASSAKYCTRRPKACSNIDRQHCPVCRPKGGGATEDIDIVCCQMRQRRRDSFEVIDQDDRYAGKQGRYLDPIDRPCSVGKADAIAIDWTGGVNRMPNPASAKQVKIRPKRKGLGVRPRRSGQPGASAKNVRPLGKHRSQSSQQYGESAQHR